MLEDLKILNGEVHLKFDPLNTKYTVFLNNKEDMELELEYELKKDTNITISGNYLDKDYNEVILTVSNGSESMNYYLYVYKDDTKTVSYQDIPTTDLDFPTTKEISPYAVPSIAAVCFLLILILFVILFHKRKSS